MALGDHVYVARLGGLYTHHGIDCGDGSIIHYTGSSPRDVVVQSTSAQVFTDGCQLQVRDYTDFEHFLRARSDPGAQLHAHFHRALDRLRGLPQANGDRSPAAVVARAQSRLGEARWDFGVNNCEHFATWCKTGLSGSKQIDAIWRTVLPTPHFFRYRTSSQLVTLFHRFGRDR